MMWKARVNAIWERAQGTGSTARATFVMASVSMVIPCPTRSRHWSLVAGRPRALIGIGRSGWESTSVSPRGPRERRPAEGQGAPVDVVAHEDLLHGRFGLHWQYIHPPSQSATGPHTHGVRAARSDLLAFDASIVGS